MFLRIFTMWRQGKHIYKTTHYALIIPTSNKHKNSYIITPRITYHSKTECDLQILCSHTNSATFDTPQAHSPISNYLSYGEQIKFYIIGTNTYLEQHNTTIITCCWFRWHYCSSWLSCNGCFRKSPFEVHHKSIPCNLFICFHLDWNNISFGLYNIWRFISTKTIY